MKRILVLTSVALGAATLAAAVRQEPAIVIGHVTTESGAPLAGALVRIEALQVGASTRADGQYRLIVPFSRLRAPGRYAVMATLAGYQRETRQVQLAPGATARQDFQLRAAAVTLNAVVTGAARPPARVTAASSSP